MKASKLIVLVGGVVGIVAFFLPLLAIERPGGVVQPSGFELVRGLDAVAALEKETGDGELAATLARVKGFVLGVYAPAALLALLGLAGVVRRRFGRLAGIGSVVLALVNLAVYGMLATIAADVGDGVAGGIGLHLLAATGTAGLAGGVLALLRPEVPADPVAIRHAATLRT